MALGGPLPGTVFRHAAEENNSKTQDNWKSQNVSGEYIAIDILSTQTIYL